LNKLGHPVRSVCQGKYFELEFEGNSGNRPTLELIARDVLSNPIIEDFYIQDGNSGTDPLISGTDPELTLATQPPADARVNSGSVPGIKGSVPEIMGSVPKFPKADK
jgi:hypothetical protein